MMSSSGISNATVISKVAQKIKSEMKDLALVAHDSMLRNSDSAVKNFLSEIELSEKVSRLMSRLLQLISKPTNKVKTTAMYVDVQNFKKQAPSCRTGAASHVSYAIW